MTPALEHQAYPVIRARQQDLFRETLTYVLKNSAFYQHHFAGLGKKIGELTIDEIGQLPVTTKDDLQRDNWKFLCVPRTQITEYASTSGTLGKPVTIALTKNDVQRLAENEFVSFSRADGTPEDLYQLMVTLDRQFMAGIAYYEGIRKLGAGLVRVGPGLPAMQWETIQRLKPTVLVCVPSFLLKLIEFANNNGIDPSTSSVKAAICIGESIRTADLKPGILALRITAAWNIRLYGTYASTEMQTAFTECRHGNGGHLNPELIYVESLDDHHKPVAPGTPGEITITTFGVEGMPLIRYKTGDIAAVHEEPCLCGRTTLRLGPVVGRKQQMIKLRGTTLYPPAVFELLNDFKSISNYVVEAFDSEHGTDELRLHLLVKAEDQQATKEHLTTAFQSRLRVIPTVTFQTSDELEKLQMAGNNRKITRFLDRRKA